ncbi:oxidoreductase [Fragilaria crotonensis]|nr:oxidoreductase [Fragilaria crotonensis]
MDDLTLPLAVAAIILVLAVIAYVVLTREKHPIALTPDFQKYPLIDKKIISHDTRRFTFALPSENHKLGLPIGQHMTLMFKDSDGKSVQRSYTPVTGDETLGTVSFVIKVYKAGVHPKFPEGGKLSQYLDTLKIGDTLDMKGPKGHLTWLGKGSFTVKVVKKPLETRKATHIGMIAGGTGITPMLQVLDAIFRDPNDKTCVKMIYANQTEDDILVRPELEAIAKKYPDRFQLHYTLDNPPKDWAYSTGFISKEMIAKYLYTPDASKKIQIFMCGPPPMIKFACYPNLEALGFTDNDWFTF